MILFWEGYLHLNFMLTFLSKVFKVEADSLLQEADSSLTSLIDNGMKNSPAKAVSMRYREDGKKSDKVKT